jgi:hypothetical protein
VREVLKNLGESQDLRPREGVAGRDPASTGSGELGLDVIDTIDLRGFGNLPKNV